MTVMKKLLKASTLLSLLLISGCSYAVNPVGFDDRHSAAADWYNKYYDAMKALTHEQELEGFVVKCGNKYHHTSYEVGGLKNSFSAHGSIDGCKKIAYLHTHPEEVRGWTTDFFSKADLKSSEVIDFYVVSEMSCKLRYAKKGSNSSREGQVLGYISKCYNGDHKRYR